MAVTIYHTPYTFTPVYNEIVFSVLSDKRTQDNFEYVCDIYFTGSVTYDIRKKVKPRADGYGVFDIHRIIEDYVTHDIAIQGTESISQNTNSYKALTVKMGEEFGLSSSGTTVYPDLATSGTIYAFNAIQNQIEFKDYNQNTFLLDDSSAKFLTNLPRTNRASKTIIDIRSSQNAWLYGIVNTASAVYQMRVITYDAADGGGSINGNFLITNNYAALSGEADRFLRFPVGTNNLNNIASGDVTASIGALPIIDAQVLSYRINTLDSGAAITSELIYFNIDDLCTKYTVYRLHFLNKLGGFDSFNFIRSSTVKNNISRNKFKKIIGDLSGTQWSYSKADRQETDFYIQSKQSITVTSDWITENEFIWLKELVESPVVMYEQDTATLIAINIMDTSYDEKKEVNEKLFNLQITFEFSYTNYRQRY